MPRESYFWHKLHSLTGIVPVGYYLVQHLTLNTFSLAGPTKFNAVIAFFDGMPTHFLLGLKVFGIWLPLLFHAVYGVFITARGQQNYVGTVYKYRENRYYTLQRVTGILAFLFLMYHVFSTSIQAKALGTTEFIQYAAWADKLSAPVLGVPYVLLVVYIVGIVACTYHFSYGIWNFCIRWGITVSERAQLATAKFATGSFVVLTALGMLALIGFFRPVFAPDPGGTVQVGLPAAMVQANSPDAR